MRKYDRKSKLLDDAKQHFRRGHKVLVKVRDVSKICTSLGQVRKFMRKHPGTHQVDVQGVLYHGTTRMHEKLKALEGE